MTIFTPHSTRVAAANRALQQGEPIDLVMQHCTWASTSTFHKYYYRPAVGPIHFRPDREIIFRPSHPSTLGNPGSLPPGVSYKVHTTQLLPITKPCSVTIVIPTSSTAPVNSSDRSPPVPDTHSVTPPSKENLPQPATPLTNTGPSGDMEAEFVPVAASTPIPDTSNRTQVEHTTLPENVVTETAAGEITSISGSIALSDLFPDVKIPRIVLLGPNRQHYYNLSKGLSIQAFHGQFALLDVAPMSLDIVCPANTTLEPETLVDIQIYNLPFKARFIPTDTVRNVLKQLFN